MASDNIVNGSTPGSSILDKLLPSRAETENENASSGGGNPAAVRTDGASTAVTKPVPHEPNPEPLSNGGVDLTPIQEPEPEPEKKDLVVRRVRHGHKRELEFALRSLTEIATSILSGSRTRNKKVRISDGGAGPSVQMGGQDPSDTTGPSSRVLASPGSPCRLSIKCLTESDEEEVRYAPNGSRTNPRFLKLMFSNGVTGSSD